MCLPLLVDLCSAPLRWLPSKLKTCNDPDALAAQSRGGNIVLGCRGDEWEAPVGNPCDWVVNWSSCDIGLLHLCPRSPCGNIGENARELTWLG
eukprot:scaffold106_cov380-Prasinococcus_capsulatus_cf.AAC.70